MVTLRNALRNALRNVLRNALRNALNVTIKHFEAKKKVDKPHWFLESAYRSLRQKLGEKRLAVRLALDPEGRL